MNIPSTFSSVFKMDDLEDINANSSEVFNVNNSSDNFDFDVLKSSEDKG